MKNTPNRGALFLSLIFFIAGVAAFFLPEQDGGHGLLRVLPNWGGALVLIGLAVLIFFLNIEVLRRKKKD